MEPGTQASFDPESSSGEPQTPVREPQAPPAPRGAAWIFLGPGGLRAGWSAVLFMVLWRLITRLAGTALATAGAFQPKAGFSSRNMFFGEFAGLVALLVAAGLMALLEQRRMADYNLAGPRRARHFFSGLAVGFAALSLLVGELAAGGWLHLSGPGMPAGALLRYALFWACLFLMVACVEEGTFRCYLQSTLTRGLDFWWALGVVAFFCAALLLKAQMHFDVLALLTAHLLRTATGGADGVYAIALLGVVPCFLLERKRAAHSAFWQAAWVTSTLFGFLHTGNGGENWIGIFSAAAIGFVFCVSIRVTGSAWWAIGCHAGWDWGETYFYGTADSGLTARGHLLTSTAAGNPLWSGGADGPEGSLLILGTLVLLLAWLVAAYGRRRGESAVETAA